MKMNSTKLIFAVALVGVVLLFAAPAAQAQGVAPGTTGNVGVSMNTVGSTAAVSGAMYVNPGIFGILDFMGEVSDAIAEVGQMVYLTAAYVANIASTVGIGMIAGIAATFMRIGTIVRNSMRSVANFFYANAGKPNKKARNTQVIRNWFN